MHFSFIEMHDAHTSEYYPYMLFFLTLTVKNHKFFKVVQQKANKIQFVFVVTEFMHDILNIP